MRHSEANIFVFLAAIIIGVLISLNINFKGESEKIFVDSKQYQEAYNTRNKLYREVSDLKERNYEYASKLGKYKYGESTNSKVLDDISKELQINNNILGYNEVKGEGLEITINDGSGEFTNNIDDPLLRWARTVHNTDMIQVVNELKNAGVEAISINGQRIMSSSEIYCSWAFLSINGVNIPAPFYVTVIGDKEKIKRYIMSNESYVKRLITRGITVDILEKEEVMIPAYTGKLEIKNIKPGKINK